MSTGLEENQPVQTIVFIPMQVLSAYVMMRMGILLFSPPISSGAHAIHRRTGFSEYVSDPQR